MLKLVNKNRSYEWVNNCSFVKKLVFILFLGSVLSCAHTASTSCNYNQYFRGQWDDFYKRALTCIEHENFQQALEDFQSSLERRPPSKQFDRRMVRTYGMHYIDYFPHREMGLVYYLNNQYEEALDYLNQSIQTEPSAKAYYYLKQTKKKMQYNKKTTDDLPEITILDPQIQNKGSVKIFRSKMPFVIKGKACDKEWINEVLINDIPVWIDHAAPCVEFNKELHFQEGDHTIHLKAQSINGKSVEKKIVLNVDQTGPALSFKKGNYPNIINIKAYDHSEHIDLWINQQPVTSSKDFLLNWEMIWPESQEKLYVCAKDKCNNETCAIITYDSLFSSPLLSGLIVENSSFFQTEIPVTSNDTIKENKINIYFNNKDNLTLYSDSIKISGNITSKRTLASVFINNKEFSLQPSKTVFFSKHIYLKPNENIISVRAIDISGFTKEKNLYVNRKIPSVFQLKHRYGLSLYPFILHNSKKESWITKLFTKSNDMGTFSYQAEIFEKDLFDILRNKERFRINYRGKAFKISEVLPNMPFQSTILGDTYISKFGLEITARVVDNQTSAVLTIKDVYRENKDEINIQEMAGELSEKIHQSFPLIKGEIVSKNEEGFRIKSSAPKFPSITWPMIIYRKEIDSSMEEKDPLIIGKASMNSYQRDEKTKIIIVNDWVGENSIQKGDFFITK